MSEILNAGENVPETPSEIFEAIKPKDEPQQPTPATEETNPEQEVHPTTQEEGKPVGEATIVDMDEPAGLDNFPQHNPDA